MPPHLGRSPRFSGTGFRKDRGIDMERFLAQRYTDWGVCIMWFLALLIKEEGQVREGAGRRHYINSTVYVALSMKAYSTVEKPASLGIHKRLSTTCPHTHTLITTEIPMTVKLCRPWSEVASESSEVTSNPRYALSHSLFSKRLQRPKGTLTCSLPKSTAYWCTFFLCGILCFFFSLQRSVCYLKSVPRW